MTMKSVPYDVVQRLRAGGAGGQGAAVGRDRQQGPADHRHQVADRLRQGQARQDDLRGRLDRLGRPPVHRAARSSAGGIDYRIVPYKGTAPAFQDLIGGQIDGFIDPILGSLQYHKAGQLRVVAVTSAKRAPNLPDVPTVGRDAAGLRVLQLVRPVGPGEAAGRHRRAAQRRGEQGAGRRHAREASSPQGLLLTPAAARTTSPSSRRDDMAASQKIITDRQHPCRVRPGQRNARARHRQQLGHRRARSRGACSPTAGGARVRTVADATHRGTQRFSASDGGPVRRRATDAAAQRVAGDVPMRWCTPPACCASAALGALSPTTAS